MSVPALYSTMSGENSLKEVARPSSSLAKYSLSPVPLTMGLSQLMAVLARLSAGHSWQLYRSKMYKSSSLKCSLSLSCPLPCKHQAHAISTAPGCPEDLAPFPEYRQVLRPLTHSCRLPGRPCTFPEYRQVLRPLTHSCRLPGRPCTLSRIQAGLAPSYTLLQAARRCCMLPSSGTWLCIPCSCADSQFQGMGSAGTW